MQKISNCQKNVISIVYNVEWCINLLFLQRKMFVEKQNL